MTEEISAPAVQDAPVVQEPSDPSPEVNKDEPAQVDVPKEKNPYEKRIDKLTARNKDYERRYSEAEKRIADLEAKLTKLPDDKPNADNFNTPEEYADALADWKLAQKEKANNEPKQPSIEEIRKQEREFAQKQITFQSKEAEFRAKEPNYDKSVSVVNQIMNLADPKDPSFAVFAQTILNAENAPALIHHLGSNPHEALGLFGKSPSEVEDALTVIIESLAAPQVPEKGESQPPEALPAPANPVHGKAQVRKHPDKMNGKELLQHMESLQRRGK